MRFQKILTLSASITIAGALLAACSGTNPMGSSIPGAGAGTQARGGALFDRHGHQILTLIPPTVGMRRLDLPHGHVRPLHMVKPPKGGIYGSMFGAPGYNGDGFQYGYPNPDTGTNTSPTCSFDANYVNGMGVDPKGVTMIPGYWGTTYSVETNLYAGPYLCGTLMASIPDTGGQPADAYSEGAATGPIAIGEIENFSSGQGDMMLCTVSGSSGSCGSPLENTSEAQEYCTEYSCAIPYVAGVAVDHKGNCYESGYTGSSGIFTPALFYWPAPCSGDALVAQGVNDPTYGGIYIDSAKNVVTDDLDGNLYVYSCKYTKAKVHRTGTTPASYVCTNLSTTAMEGDSLFFNIGKDGLLAAGDVANGTVDIYSYSPTGSTYEYSISTDLAVDWTEAGAISPSMK